jgi:hypothetical protein
MVTHGVVDEGDALGWGGIGSFPEPPVEGNSNPVLALLQLAPTGVVW